MEANRIDPGLLNQRVNIYLPVMVSDGYGGTACNLGLPIATDWAKIAQMKQTRRLQYAQITNNQLYVIHMRYNPELILTTKNLIKWGDELLTLHSINDLDVAGNFLEIIAYTKE